MQDIRFWNCLWLILPILLWNFIMSPKLSQKGFQSDRLVPLWILILENIFRIISFISPILIPLETKEPLQLAGIFVYISGALIYFISWIPLTFFPKSSWSKSPAGVLSPHITPFFFFLGIALVGKTWIFALISLLFIFLHTAHGLYSFKILKKEYFSNK